MKIFNMVKVHCDKNVISKDPKTLEERSNYQEIQADQANTLKASGEEFVYSESNMEEYSKPIKEQEKCNRCHNKRHKNKTHSSCGTCPCNTDTFCYHHRGHSSALKHLCICKICRDKVGNMFSLLQDPLLYIYIIRKDFIILCCYVTPNAVVLNYTHSIWVRKRNTTKGLDIMENNICSYYGHDQDEFGKWEMIKQLTHLICLLIVTLLSLKFSVQTEKKRTVLKANYVAGMSLIFVLLSSRQMQTGCNTTRSHETKGKYTKDMKHKIIQLLDVIIYDKKGCVKKTLYDIINYCSPSRYEKLHVYPVSRHFNETMSAELLRVGSLSTYPHENVPSLIRLAESGFYYNGNEKELICFSCGTKYSDWTYNSVPMEIHRSISPNCQYLKEKSNRTERPMLGGLIAQHNTFVRQEVQQPTHLLNIETDNHRACSDSNEGSTPTLLVSSSPKPLTINSHDSGYGSSFNSRSTTSRSHQSSVLTSSSSGYSSGYRSGSISNQSSDCSQQHQLPVLIEERREASLNSYSDTSVRDSNIQSNSRANIPKAKYPEYELKQRRLETYKNWPSNLTFLHPLDLSECGFFYSNFGDCVRCYHCGIGLRNWESDDNPWVEHARWSRKCPYLLQKKGQQFIDTVLTALGLQTDSEIEQQTSNRNSELSSQSSGIATASSSGNDVRDPIQHPAAVYVITEKIFGDKKERLVKKTMNQLLQDHDWDNITTDMLINTVIDKHANELTDADQNPQRSDVKSESKSTSEASEPASSIKSGNINSSASNGGEDCDRIQKENEELKDLYTCKICLDERVGITFVPCGHLVTCKNCSPQIRRCPLCRTFIRGTIKTTI